MKKLFNTNFLILATALICFTFVSCKDMCYECVGFDDGTTMLEDLGTICEGADNGQGGTFSEDDIHSTVATYRNFGGTCTMKE